MNKYRYINLATGEVVNYLTILGARRYFKKDAKHYNYNYEHRSIVSIKKARKMGLI